MERTQPEPAHVAPPLARYGRPASRLDAEAAQMLREIADRLERNRADEPLTPTGRIALIQATTMSPPLARRLRDQAPEITERITRSAYAALLREIAGPAEPLAQPDLPEPTPWTEDRTATAGQIVGRAAVDYAREQARRAQLAHQDRVHGNEPGGDH